MVIPDRPWLPFRQILNFLSQWKGRWIDPPMLMGVAWIAAILRMMILRVMILRVMILRVAIA